MSKPEFNFVPRKLSKPSKAVGNPPSTRTPSSHQHRDNIQLVRVGTSSNVSGERKGKFLDDSAYASLFVLALSDHALWSNAELLEAMEANEEGFVAISYLVRISRTFAGLSVVPPEAVLIRCVRSSSALEGRIMISSKTGAEAQGGYEVRRKDWSQVRDRIRKYTSYQWDSRTIYVENLPFRARTYHAVYEFVHQLLPRDSEPSAFPVQSVSFPPHKKDDPNDPPTTGKGFAFIILSRTTDVDHFLHRWPWNLDVRPNTLDAADEVASVVREAVDLGFRCLSKHEWDKLKEEYLTLQRRLLERTLAANVPAPSTGKRAQPSASPEAVPRSQDRDTSAIMQQSEAVVRADDPPIWFPRDCLVFVKNVHPETNKTTLRTLFSSAFNKNAVTIDYVDYNKGLDSCHLRLSDPQNARSLISYFSEHRMAQVDALDNEGASTTGDIFIEMVLVQGKREEMYWEKVPEKIRRAAIASSQGKKTDEVPVRVQKGDTGSGSGRKRKRRKHE